MCILKIVSERIEISNFFYLENVTIQNDNVHISRFITFELNCNVTTIFRHKITKVILSNTLIIEAYLCELQLCTFIKIKNSKHVLFIFNEL